MKKLYIDKIAEKVYKQLIGYINDKDKNSIIMNELYNYVYDEIYKTLTNSKNQFDVYYEKIKKQYYIYTYEENVENIINRFVKIFLEELK